MNNEIKFNMEIDLETGQIIGKASSDQENSTIDDISYKITQSISKIFQSNGSDWIKEYEDHLLNNETDKAYDLLSTKAFFLSKSIEIKTFNKLIKLDYTKLSEEKSYRFQLLIISIGYTSGLFNEIEVYVNRLLDFSKEKLEENIYGNLLLTKAEILHHKRLFFSATELLQKIIDTEKDNIIKAFAYKQLGLKSIIIDDKIKYLKISKDYFLLGGNRRETVNVLLQISDLQIENDPLMAIDNIDRAIEYLDSEKSIEKELRASVLQRKVRILFERNRIEDCEKIISEVIKLRNDLVGNEEQKFSSYKFAEEIARLTGNTEKEDEYQKRAEEISTSIQSEEFSLRLDLIGSISKKLIENTELHNKILSSPFSKLKVSLLILLSIKSSKSFEERLKLLDQVFIIGEQMSPGLFEESLAYQALG